MVLFGLVLPSLISLFLIQVYKMELEEVPQFNRLTDFCRTFKLQRGRTDDNDDDENDPSVVGEFKVKIQEKKFFVPSDSDKGKSLLVQIINSLSTLWWKVWVFYFHLFKFLSLFKTIYHVQFT